MNIRPPFYLLSVAALLITACNSSSQPSDAQSGSLASSHVSSPHGFTTATITDPALNNMAAETISIPAGWKLQGIMIESPCTSAPSAVYRAYAPDGLTEMRSSPMIAWRWSADPHASKPAGCLPFSGPLSAADVLNKYVETIPGGVHVVGPMTLPAAAHKPLDDMAANMNQQAQQHAMAPPFGPPHYTADVAALHIQTRNGSFVIDQRVNASVFCEIRPSGFMAGGNCSAQVGILRAPQGKLDALIRIADDPNLPRPQLEPQWKETQQQILYKQGQANMAAVQRQSEIGMARQKATFDAFMATSQQNHEAFMNQQESRFQSSMNNAVNSMNAQSTAASDMIDYSLDQQTVTGSGGTVHVSNAYSQTWSNGQNQWYQTNDPNSNPNGTLPGNWTQNTKVHGNGQSY